MIPELLDIVATALIILVIPILLIKADSYLARMIKEQK